MRYPDFEARVWAVGQVVSAKAALELLAERAEPKSGKPWPEFAEYACFACHHDLKQPSPRQNRGFVGQLPGTLIWNPWYVEMLPILGRESPSVAVAADSPLWRLRQGMDNLRPDRARVAAQGREAASPFPDWARTAAAHPWGVAEARQALKDLATATVPPSWESAAQRYLALGAMFHALTDLDQHQSDPDLRRSIKGLADPLRFPPGYDSPASFDLRSFAEKLETLRKQLGP